MTSPLTDAAAALLDSYPPQYTERAILAVQKGKAFCPACAWAGISNCGYFDECGAFVMPDGSAAGEACVPKEPR